MKASGYGGLSGLDNYREKSKSKPCTVVLKLMDNDFTYHQAIKIALIIYHVNKVQLENEVNLYI